MGVNSAILNMDELEQADLDSLKNETTIFETISIGIALSIARCDGLETCPLTVEENEVKALIEALDNRIGSLTLKQEEASDPVIMDEVITAYINQRDNFSTHLESLKTLKSTLDTDSALTGTDDLEPDISVEEARNAALLEYVEDELLLFEDDEELVDDEGAEDLPPIPTE